MELILVTLRSFLMNKFSSKNLAFRTGERDGEKFGSNYLTTYKIFKYSKIDFINYHL